MAEYVKFTEEQIEALTDKFRNNLRDKKIGQSFDMKELVVESLQIDDPGTCFIDITSTAWLKIQSLVKANNKEIGWHGTVRKENSEYYIIEDIYVYPQVVTGASIRTDQDKYTDWGLEFTNDVFNKMKFHGHSHVNLSVSPSGQDEEHQDGILSGLRQDSFYIFMIINKSGSMWIKVIDLEDNVQYCSENKGEIELNIISEDGVTIKQFVEEADKSVTEQPVTRYGKYGTYKGTKGTTSNVKTGTTIYNGTNHYNGTNSDTSRTYGLSKSDRDLIELYNKGYYEDNFGNDVFND